jgi:hypothetical protein
LLQFQDENVKVLQAVKIWAERLQGKANALAAGFLKRHWVFCEAIVFGEADPPRKKSPPKEFPAAGLD